MTDTYGTFLRSERTGMLEKPGRRFRARAACRPSSLGNRSGPNGTICDGVVLHGCPSHVARTA